MESVNEQQKGYFNFGHRVRVHLWLYDCIAGDINAPRNIASMSLCWPERNCSSCFRHISSLSLCLLLCSLSFSPLQLEMEKMTRVSTISGCTMFCHLDAPANAISVCRDATQVKMRFTTQAKVPN